MEYWMNCQLVCLYEVYFNTLIWTWMWASGNKESHDGNKTCSSTSGSDANTQIWSWISENEWNKEQPQGQRYPWIPVILNQWQLWKQWRQEYIDLNLRVKQRQLGAEYELDQIEVIEGIQMTGRQGSEWIRQPAATREAVTATINRLSHDGNKTCNRASGNNNNTQISEREFPQSSRTRNNPKCSSTLRPP